MRHPRDENERTTSFTGIPPHMSILSRMEGIRRGQEALKDGVVSKMTEEFVGRQILGGFNQYQMRDILQGFRDNIMNE